MALVALMAMGAIRNWKLKFIYPKSKPFLQKGQLLKHKELGLPEQMVI
jgi:hypothetical protein